MRLLLLFLPFSIALDFRSQTYKSIESYSNLASNSGSSSNHGNPYLQFTHPPPSSFNNPYVHANQQLLQPAPSSSSYSASASASNELSASPEVYSTNYQSIQPQQLQQLQQQQNLLNKPVSSEITQLQPQPQLQVQPLQPQQQPQQQQYASNHQQQQWSTTQQTTSPTPAPTSSWFTSSQTYKANTWLPNLSATAAVQHIYPAVTTRKTPPPVKTTKKPRTTTTTAAPFIWTTETAPSTKTVAKMSKLSVRPVKKGDKGEAAQISVPSHRLLNDILVIPSSRRLYILAIIPIHESADNKGFDCGRVDVNGFIRLGAFLDALNQINSQSTLKDAGISLGAVIVDSCSSDLRTVADLYELLSGTNIQKTDLIAMIRDDGSHLPNVDEFARHLKIPVINTFFAPKEHMLSTGTLPSMSSPLESMLSLLQYTKSSCVSLIYDDLHEDSARLLNEMSLEKGICLEQRLNLKGGAALSLAESAVRRMLLTEARVVIVLLGEDSWIQLMKAFRTEMVIAGRFILLTVQNPRWFTSKQFVESWPHFDQLLLTVTNKKPNQHQQLNHLTTQFPKFPFPAHWMRQFWSTAFHCHIEGENENGEQFSTVCSHKQVLNLTSVAPDVDISPITIAVHSIAHATRKLVDKVCPGALVQSLNDCMNEPQESLFSALMALRYHHALSDAEVYFNDTSGYRDIPMLINRIVFESQLIVEPLASWDTLGRFTYTAPMELVMEERDGSRVPLRSTCPKSTCSAELAKRSQSGQKPTFRESLNSAYLLIYVIGAVMAFFICMLCMYHQIVSSKADPYSICTIFMFGALSVLCLVSILFVMKPNPISCAARRTAFSISLTAVFAPIFVKTMAVWRMELAGGHKDLTSIRSHPAVLFWISFGLVLVQAVIAGQWALFESPTEMTFTTSVQHGHQWRCSPGENFEQRLLHSCVFPGLLVLISLVCSILSVKHLESRQNILITLLAGGLAIALYVALPLIPFTLRDQLIAGVLVTYSFLVILITYCRGAFAKSDDFSSRGSLMDKSTMDRSEKNPFWLDNHVLSPRGHTLSMQRNYQQASTLPQQQQMGTIEKYALEGFAAPRIISTQGSNISVQNVNNLMDNTYPRPQTLQRPQSSAHRYGVDSYELPPVSPHPTYQTNTLPYSTSKYGKQEFLLEEDTGNSRL